MKLVVEVTEEVWKSIQQGTWCGSEIIAKGLPIDDCDYESRIYEVVEELRDVARHNDGIIKDCYQKALQLVREKLTHY